jgi:hypothetical protein
MFTKSDYKDCAISKTNSIKIEDMGTLDIIAVVALVIIGGFIYWNKTKG